MEPSVEIIRSVNQAWDTTLPENANLQQATDLLAGYIDVLIRSDFDKLIFLLYRTDVSETRLRGLLKEQQGENAARLIAGLIIERQALKVTIRRQFRQEEKGDIDEEERW